jgi:hypothetical protein
VAVVAAMLACTSSAVAATSSGTSLESPAVREALARQLQLPGPVTVTQGGSGGTGGASPPAGELVPSLATAFSDTWSARRSPLVTRIFNQPVNYKTSDAQWHAIDDSLVASALGGYENAANSFSLRLPESLTSGVSVSDQGRTVSFTLEGAAASLPSVSGDTATYARVLPSTDLAYVSESGGVREIATLRDSGAPSELRYSLSLASGLTPHQRGDGSIAITDGQGGTLFTIPAPAAYRPGAGPASGRGLPTTIAQSGASWLITVNTGEAWLREQLASGPVAIDPTVTVSATQACTLNAESPKATSCSSSTLQEGYDSTHQEHHSLLEFGLGSIPQASVILNAKLGLYVEAHSTTTAKAVGVYRVTKPWSTSATWETYDGTHAWTTPGGDYNNPSEKSDASVNASVGVSTGWYYWYPTKMVQEWVNTANAPEQGGQREGAANEGLIVKDQKDSETQNLLTLASPTASANKPFIEVVYTKRGVGVEPQYTQVSTPVTDKLTMSVNVASGNLMLANKDMHIAGVNGVDFTSNRYYNNLQPEEHDLGAWRESMFVEAGEYANGDVHVGNGTGPLWVFQKQPTGNGYITPPGIKAKLCTNATTTKESPCPETWPSSEIKWRLVYEDPEERYVDFTSFGWALHFGNKYEPKLTAGFTEGAGAITSWTDTRGRVVKYSVLPNTF